MMMTSFKIPLLAVMALAVFSFSHSALAQESAFPAQQIETAGEAAGEDAGIVTRPVQPARKQNPISAFFTKFYTALVGGGAEPDPSATMIAPFESETKPFTAAEMGASGLAVNKSTLDQPHRSASDLGETVQRLVAESLSFTAIDYPEHLKNMARSFTPQGAIEFNAWATGTGTLDALRGNQLQLNGFVSDKPFLLNEGVVAGRYRWLFEVPVMVSFVPLGMSSYRVEQGTDTRRLLVMLQIGRNPQSTLDDQIFIESWSVKDNTRKN